MSIEREHFDKIKIRSFRKQRVGGNVQLILEGLDISVFSSHPKMLDKDFVSLRLESFSGSPRIWFFLLPIPPASLCAMDARTLTASSNARVPST